MDQKSMEQLIAEVVSCQRRYALLHGDAKGLLPLFPESSVDCVITSPPYWNLRDYNMDEISKHSQIGMESDPQKYVDKLVEVFREVRRVLRPTGSLWLNIGDKYHKKRLMGIPWQVALALQENGWILRNEVIWNQMKGSQSSKDRLRMNRESIFHFVKQTKYYYAWQRILVKPSKQPNTNNGHVISATGVSGIKYRELIAGAKALTENERASALAALEETIEKVRTGQVVDFRMYIRGQHRVLHSDSSDFSGRAKELAQNGYYILMSRAEGYMPTDIWNIVPEDEWRRDVHYAVFPVELLKIPIKATCPDNGLMLDPFVGTGSTIIAALQFGSRGVGVDVSSEYLKVAEGRIASFQGTFPSRLASF